jgi:hypothetical protein
VAIQSDGPGGAGAGEGDEAADLRAARLAALPAATWGDGGGKGKGKGKEKGTGKGKGGKGPAAPPRPPTLLRKLLAKEERDEHSLVLQLFRYCPGPPGAVKRPQRFP